VRDHCRACQTARLVDDSVFAASARSSHTGLRRSNAGLLDRRRRPGKARTALADPIGRYAVVQCRRLHDHLWHDAAAGDCLRSIRPNQSRGRRLDLSFNTRAISFITNPNWPETRRRKHASYLVQMLGMTHQNFLSAATGHRVAPFDCPWYVYRLLASFTVCQLYPPPCTVFDLFAFHVLPYSHKFDISVFLCRIESNFRVLAYTSLYTFFLSISSLKACSFLFPISFTLVDASDLRPNCLSNTSSLAFVVCLYFLVYHVSVSFSLTACSTCRC